MSEIHYIGLDNRYNSLCFHISVMHLLHSSSTLNRLLSEIVPQTYTEYITVMMRPLAIYSKESNKDMLYHLMKRAYKDLCEYILTEEAYNGYSPTLLLQYYYLPIIYTMFPSEFVNICSEISVPIIEINTHEFKFEDIIQSRRIIRDEFIEGALRMYSNMKSFVKKFDGIQKPLSLNAWILEVYPNERNTIGGHSVFIYRKYKDYWKVIDDDSITCSLSKYIRGRFIARIAIYNITSELVNEIENQIGIRYHTMTRRVGNRFEFICSDPERVIHRLNELRE